MTIARTKRFFKGALVAIVVATIVVFAFYRAVFIKTNEFGPLGMDWAGRQVMIQSLDNFFKSYGVRVTSEWDDTTFVGRFLLGSPMRTRLIFEYPEQITDAEATYVSGILGESYEGFLSEYQVETITLTEHQDISVDEIRQFMQKHQVARFEDYLRACGFTHFVVRHGQSGEISKELASTLRPNTSWHGGE